MPKVVFPPRFHEEVHRSAPRRPQPVAPRYPRRGPGQTGRRLPRPRREWFDGAIHNDDSADDVLHAPLPTVHVLSGPIAVQGAQPGDLLVVDILDVGPIPQEDSGPFAGQGWGYTGVFATDNGGGFLTEWFPDAYKAIWDFRGGIATSRAHAPGVLHRHHAPGIHGYRPLRGAAGQVERPRAALIATDPNRVPPLALPPLPDSAILGSLTGAEFDRVAARPHAPHRRGRTAATRTSRTSPREAGCSTRCSSTERTCPWVTCTSPKATARSPSAAPSRWAGSWTCEST